MSSSRMKPKPETPVIIRIAAVAHVERALTNRYPGTINSLYRTGRKILGIKDRPMSSSDRGIFIRFLRSRGWKILNNNESGPATWHCPNPRPLKRKKRKRMNKPKTLIKQGK